MSPRLRTTHVPVDHQSLDMIVEVSERRSTTLPPLFDGLDYVSRIEHGVQPSRCKATGVVCMDHLLQGWICCCMGVVVRSNSISIILVHSCNLSCNLAVLFFSTSTNVHPLYLLDQTIGSPTVAMSLRTLQSLGKVARQALTQAEQEQGSQLMTKRFFNPERYSPRQFAQNKPVDPSALWCDTAIYAWARHDGR